MLPSEDIARLTMARFLKDNSDIFSLEEDKHFGDEDDDDDEQDDEEVVVVDAQKEGDEEVVARQLCCSW